MVRLNARESVLKVDIDKGKKPLSRALIRWRLERAGFRLQTVVQRRSPSGKGWHQIITVSPRPQFAIEVVALQLLLASDPMREACNLRRARVLDRMPAWARGHFNVLYEKVGEP